MLRKTNFSKSLYYFIFCLAGIAVTFCGTNQNNGPIITQGTDAAVLLISGASDFGAILLNETSVHTFTVTNIGKSTATQITGSFYLSIAYSYLEGTFPGTGGTCNAVLDSGKSCTVVVAFTPKYSGSSQTVLEISYDNGTSRVSTQDPMLKGSGV